MPHCKDDRHEPLVEREVDGRALRICCSCGHFSYAAREWTGGNEVIVDKIAEDVARTGQHRVHTVILINTAFRADGDKTSGQMMKAWAPQHLLRFREVGEFMLFERDGIALRALMDSANEAKPRQS